MVKFFIILTSLCTERDHKAALMCQKVKVQLYEKNTPESDYSLLLTPYSFSFILKQLSLASGVKKITTSDDIHTVDTSEGPKTVSPLGCECIFFTSMKLPCRHILALRQKLELPLLIQTYVTRGGHLNIIRQLREYFSLLLPLHLFLSHFQNVKRQGSCRNMRNFEKPIY